jgi:hypothetical protein
VKNRFQSLPFKRNLHRYSVVGAMLGDPHASSTEGLSKKAAQRKKVGLCVALNDAHWSAMYREPMT